MLDRPTAQSIDFAVRVHRQLPADWPSLNAMGHASGHAFQTREFLDLWSRTFGSSDAIEAFYVDVLSPVGALVLRVPLAIETRRGIRTLGFADQSTADYNAPMLYPTSIVWTAESAQAMWAAVEAALPAFDKLLLDKMPARIGGIDNPLYLIATGNNPESCHGSNLLLPLAEIEETQAQLKTLKRKSRGLDKVGPTRFIVAEDRAERDRLLARLFDQKQRRFEETQVPGFAESPMTRAFFEQATEELAASGNLRFVALQVGGELVATNWGVVLGSTLYSLMIGFEAGEWFKHSPGRVLNLRYLAWAKAAGLSYVDHGIGDEGWKRESCDTHVPLAQAIVARSARGKRAMAREALAARVRSTALYQRLRPLKWIVKREIARRLKASRG